MIVNYRDKQTADFAAGKRIRAFSGIEKAARLRLDRLEAAATLQDLAILPGNRFESGVTAEASTAFESTTGGGFASNGPRAPPDPKM